MPIGGDLRERLRFERRTIGPDDGYGNVSKAWDLLAGPMSARIESQTGSEDVQAERPTGVQPVNITVRYSPEAAQIQSQDRAVDCRTGRTYNVIAVANEDQRRRYLTVTATSGVADG